MKIAIIGSRSFNDYNYLKTIIDSIDDISMIVSGGAIGADSLGARYAKENDLPLKIFLPDWERFGKAAGFKRNKQIVDYSDIGIAFWDGQSKGTKHSIDLFNKVNKSCIIINTNKQDDLW